jgi:hypothetical protein
MLYAVCCISHQTSSLVNEFTGDKMQLRRLDPCPSIRLRKEGQVAKVQSQAATDLAYSAIGEVLGTIDAAEKEVKVARRRRAGTGRGVVGVQYMVVTDVNTAQPAQRYV